MKAFAAIFLLALASRALAQTIPGPPTDPILSLHYTQSQIAFARAPPAIIAACRDVPFAAAWILARAMRPEGKYILLTGYFWMQPDMPGPQRPVLQNDYNGGIYLLRRDGSCQPLWDPDNAFGDFFPETPDGKPTSNDLSIIHDLGLDMIRRDEQAFGGRLGLIHALDATGPADRRQDIAIQRLLAQLRNPVAPTP